MWSLKTNLADNEIFEALELRLRALRKAGAAAKMTWGGMAASRHTIGNSSNGVSAI